MHDNLSNELLDLKHFDFYNSKLIDNYIRNHLNSKDINKFEKLTIVHENSLNTLVSSNLFQKENIDQYLKFNNNIIESDTYKFDTLDNNEIVNIFVCNQNDYSILDIYNSSIMHCHQTSLLINTFIKLNINKETSNIYININKSTFNIIFIKNNKIQFINTFDFNTSEDLIYYILFCLEQLELNPEKIQTTISGKIFKEYYDIIYKYIRNVSIYNSNLSSKSRYYNNFKNQILNTY